MTLSRVKCKMPEVGGAMPSLMTLRYFLLRTRQNVLQTPLRFLDVKL